LRVWLASFPRSGNTFLRAVLNMSYDIPSDTVYAGEWEGLSMGWGGALPSPDASLVDGPTNDLRVTKTHELAAADDPTPAIYLVRDGRDAYVSYAHFAMETDPTAHRERTYNDVLRGFVESRDQFGGWSQHVEAWTRRDASTAVIHFEQLVAGPEATVARACAELDMPLPASSGRVPSFAELKVWRPTWFRQGKIGSWKREMPAEIEALFWEVHGATMTRIGYTREGWAPSSADRSA
jgi:hypothetical protein